MLTAPQLEAATLLALGELPRPDVAQRVGISERTLYRWMDLEEFKGEIERQARAIARGLVPKAIARLGRLLDKGADPVAHQAIVTTLKLAKWIGGEAEAEVETERRPERLDPKTPVEEIKRRVVELAAELGYLPSIEASQTSNPGR